MSAQGEITSQRRKAKILEFPSVTPKDTRLVVPREHGSWALLLLPLISGCIVGYFAGPAATLAPALWLFCVAMAAFLIQQPLQILLGVSVLKARSVREQRVAVLSVVGLSVIAAVALINLLQWHRILVLVFGVVALACFAVAAFFGNARQFRIAKQIVGALGLTITAAAGYYVVAGRINRTALLLWLASWLFASGQIEYVQLRMHTVGIKARYGRAKTGWKVGALHLLALAASGSAVLMAGMPPLFALIFVPALIRFVVWMLRPARPLKLYVLGFSELVQSIAFSALLTAAFLFQK